MSLPFRVLALIVTFAAFCAGPSMASGTAAAPQPQPLVTAPADAPAGAAERLLCAPGQTISFTDLGALPMNGHKDDPSDDPIVCNEDCNDFGQDCSHICGDDSGFCTPIALPSGLCFFCLC